MDRRFPLFLFTLLLFLDVRSRAQVTFQRIYELRPTEGVFAYARISPSGESLAYASEMRVAGAEGDVTQTVTVVDLRTSHITFTTPGVDGYWSNDGERLIFMSRDPSDRVDIRYQKTGAILQDVAPPELGDYFSWGVRDGKDLILTVRNNYYFLNGRRADLPEQWVRACEGIGTGERPLLSRNGRRITTFVRGAVVVRNLTDCKNILNTGIHGAKADFSWDSRYIAFHRPKSEPGASGYEIVVVDTKRRTIRTVTHFEGSSLFPSWTQDGRLCFRYDGEDYRGFILASNVLAAPARPLNAENGNLLAVRHWHEIFGKTREPEHHLNLVMIWASWSAHGPYALKQLQRADADFGRKGIKVGVMTALEPGSHRSDADLLLHHGRITLSEIPLSPDGLRLTEAANQIPTTLLFCDGLLIDRKLGAQSSAELLLWVSELLITHGSCNAQ